MAEFSCEAAGADSCGWKAQATSEEELLAEVANHLRDKHNVAHVTNTLAKYALAVSAGQARPAR